MDTLVFAYYCSGHGYGHATRVSAFARHLLSLSLPRRLTIHIVSSAPRHVFADSIACGALYRYADIDPVIVQPLAYRVDRQKSVQVLEEFLAKKDAMLDRERAWLTDIGANCVLSDAAFLGCLAAKSACIPSVLITNFTFDSVYSYLATSLVDSPAQTSITPSSSTLSPSPSTATDASISSTSSDQLLPDTPIPESTLAPLVQQLHEGYQHADLLLRLPGHIPIPSFLSQPALPSSEWVDPILNKFHPSVTNHLLSPLDSNLPLHSPKSFPSTELTVPRSVRAAPLLVRPPSPHIYTPEGRAEFLKKTGLPDFKGMKILVVSFGGQVFKRPGSSRTSSRIQSRFPSQEALAPEPKIEKRPYSKRASRNYHNFQTTSTSMDGLALKPRDMNTRVSGLRLDLDALDKGLRTHIKSKSSDTAKRYTNRTGTPHYSDENASGYVSSDIDNNGGTSSHRESDHESRPNKNSGIIFSPENTTTPVLDRAEYITAPNLSKRRHTLPRRRHRSHDLNAHRRYLATPSHLLIPGAPPASKPAQTIMRTPSLGKANGNGRLPSLGGVEVVKVPEMCVIPPTPKPSLFGNAGAIGMAEVEGLTRTPSSSSSSSGDSEVSPVFTTTSQTSTHVSDEGFENEAEEGEGEAGLLPDEHWIAVICGVSKEQWNAENEEGGLPEGFYVAPRDVYMPDLIAVGDVVLGKLGYGMTSECVDACTPFVYVSRPLFIEEHGLRMYLDQEGVGIELSRSGYENGDWAKSVEEAYCKGWEIKEAKRRKEYEFYKMLKKLDEQGVDGGDERRLSERERQGREMARGVVEWVDKIREEMGRRVKGKKKSLQLACLEGAATAAPVTSLPDLQPLGCEVKGIMVA